MLRFLVLVEYLIAVINCYLRQQFSLVGNIVGLVNEVNQRRALLVLGWQACKPSWYVTSHPGQLSLAIPPWVGAVSTSESWDVNRHTVRCTGPISVVWQCKLVMQEGHTAVCISSATAVPRSVLLGTGLAWRNSGWMGWLNRNHVREHSTHPNCGMCIIWYF